MTTPKTKPRRRVARNKSPPAVVDTATLEKQAAALRLPELTNEKIPDSTVVNASHFMLARAVLALALSQLLTVSRQRKPSGAKLAAIEKLFRSAVDLQRRVVFGERNAAPAGWREGFEFVMEEGESAAIPIED